MSDSNLFSGSLDTNVFDELYNLYKTNPNKLEKAWVDFFTGFDFALQGNDNFSIDSNVVREFNVIKLIDAYRKRGHLFTQTNPVRSRRNYQPPLDIEYFDLSDDDLDKEFEAGTIIGLGRSKLSDIIEFLKQTYCSNIGSEYMFIRDTEEVAWLKHNIESSRNTPSFDIEKKKEIFQEISHSVDFEQFIHRRFPGQKRFSLEGNEALVPALNYMIRQAASCGMKEVSIGMSHRGRLNVLANVLKKPMSSIFREYTGTNYKDQDFLGDVKYHLGFRNTLNVEDKNVEVYLLPNPSHLEAVDGVLQGFTRAHLDKEYAGDNNSVLPVLIHGDAAIASQGVVYEVVQMSQLDGYKTGGTIHFVVNNQIGFTTNYLDGRSSTYCTDIGKVIKAPIFHVNSDDPEALVHVVEMAVRYRQKFHTDVFIDILGYRKYGHNEGDEPRFTQPDLYLAITNHLNVKELYKKQLLTIDGVSDNFITSVDNDFNEILDEALDKARQQENVNIYEFPGTGHEVGGSLSLPSVDAIKKDGIQLFSPPVDGDFFPKALKLMTARLDKLNAGNVDWGMAELLAYAAVLRGGKPVRLSGQDSVRGTFSHRHAAVLYKNGKGMHTPLKHLFEGQPNFSVFNSPLSEYGVMGFEYGYALGNPQSLVIWEAQFGDFNNVAQPIIDQYIVAAEDKWGMLNDLVLFLPHGYEGQGAEHSSARIERFLQLAVDGNICVAQPTTPANLYHLLVDQAGDRKRPLIVFTPKSLLRHPKVVSTLEELGSGAFEKIRYPLNFEANDMSRIVLTSGKLYYDLIEKQEELGIKNTLLISVEQLHPFPIEKIESIMSSCVNVNEIIWAQEEPMNMGAWSYIMQELYQYKLRVVARPASGSPAVGLNSQHKIQQQKLIDKSFGICDCERQNVFCNLQCSRISKPKDL